jgi:hypothetical protein
MMGSCARWTSALLVLLASRTALGDEGAHERAAAAFQEGRRWIEQGNCDAAVPKFKESLQHESSVGARINIVDCVEKSDPLQAWRLLKEASALALLTHDERMASLEQRASALESRLAMLSFRLPPAADQPGFELRVDGELVDRYLYRSAFATAPGKHVVEAYASGRHFSGSVVAEAGVQTGVDVELRAETCPPKAEGPVTLAAAPPDPGASRRTLGMAIGGMGVVSIATGAVFGVLTLGKRHSIEGACGGSLQSCGAPSGSVDARTEAAKTTATLSTVSLIAGGVALLGGAVLYFTAPSSRKATMAKIGRSLLPPSAEVVW